jgi:hypothetical protein
MCALRLPWGLGAIAGSRAKHRGRRQALKFVTVHIVDKDAQAAARRSRSLKVTPSFPLKSCAGAYENMIQTVECP